MNFKERSIRIFPDIVVIFLLALILRIGFLYLVTKDCAMPPKCERLLTPDSSNYNFLALNMLSKKRFVPDIDSPYYYVSILRTPVYPAFLAMLYFFSKNNYILVGIVQSILSSFTCVLLYIIGLELFGRKTGFTGGILGAVSLLLIINSPLILTDTLFGFLLMFSLVCFIWSWSQKSNRWLIACAFLLSMTILCRPIAQFYPIFLCVLIMSTVKLPFLQRVKRTLCFAIIITIFVVGWVGHNWLRHRVPVFSGISSYSLLYYNAASLYSDIHGVDRERACEKLDEEVNLHLKRTIRDRKESWAERISAQRYVARKIIFEKPLRYFILHLKQDLRTLRPASGDFYLLLEIEPPKHGLLKLLENHGFSTLFLQYWKISSWPENISRLSIFVLYLSYWFLILGAVGLIKSRQWAQLFLFVGTIFYYLLLPGAPSNSRFRVPVEPFICLLAAEGIMFLGSNFSRIIKFFDNLR